jgi:hypothetical protein
MIGHLNQPKSLLDPLNNALRVSETLWIEKEYRWPLMEKIVYF